MKSIQLTWILLPTLVWPALIDLHQTNQYSNSSILQTVCNKDMQLNFYFQPWTVLTCSDYKCSVSGAHHSSLLFLDINRVYLRPKLIHAEVTSEVLVSGYDVPNCRYFIFYFMDDYGNKVDVIIPFVYGSGSTTLKHLLTVGAVDDETFKTQPIQKWRYFQDPSQGLGLDAFNFLNYRDYSKFAQVASHNKTHTVLINEWVFNLPFDYPNHTITMLAQIDIVPDYAGSGNKICYASYSAGTGLFQTHLRQNWPLWTCFFVILFFWAYYLIAPAQNNEVFDSKFREDKMTCWGFYSLHFLAYDQFFSRLSRSSLLLLTNAFQAVVLAALYTTIGVSVKLYSDYSMVAWMAVVAAVSSSPVQYLMGGLFLRPIYNTRQRQLELKNAFNLNEVHSKEISNAYLVHNHRVECRLARTYYWYYLIVFFGFICFWAGAIHMTLWMHFQFYYLQRLWLASYGICFVLDNLVIDPALALLFGSTSPYRLRGFYYRFELGELYKKNYIQQ